MYECRCSPAKALTFSYLLDFADKAVADVNILLTHTVLVGSFVNGYLFNQRIQKLRCQFGGVGVLLDKRNPRLRIDSCLLFRLKLGGQPFDLLGKLLLLGLVFLRHHIEVILRDATIRPVLIQLRKLAVNLRRCADRVNLLTESARVQSRGDYHTDERILACLSSSSSKGKSCANRDAARPYWKPRAKGIAPLWIPHHFLANGTYIENTVFPCPTTSRK